MKARWILFTASAMALAVVSWAQGGALGLIINGKAIPGKTLVVKGQTYVPLSALKAAGATVSTGGGKLSISFAAAGGANQVLALEGGLNEWLFNGIWRFRVTSVVPNDDGRAGWKVNVELRNGTKADNVALGGTGFESLSLIMADGNAIKPYNITDLDRPLGQGASVTVGMVFYDDEGGGRKPEKLILRIQPDEPTKSFLKRMGMTYTVGDPSFRVKLGS